MLAGMDRAQREADRRQRQKDIIEEYPVLQGLGITSKTSKEELLMLLGRFGRAPRVQEKLVPLNVRVREGLRDKFQAKAHAKGASQQALMEEILSEYLL